MPTGITGLTNIGNGLAADDGTGDGLRTGADKINANNAAIVTAVNNIAASQSAGRISYLTKAELDADLAHADGTLAEVTNDPTLANNHAYRKSGASGAGSWGVTVDRIDLVTADIDAATAATAAAQAAAEGARDAAIIGSGVYPDEPTGRAAVADGAAFKVQGSGDIAAYEYRRTNSSTSALIATYPSVSAVQKLPSPISRNGTMVADIGATMTATTVAVGSRPPTNLVSADSNAYRGFVAGWLAPATGGIDTLQFNVDNVNASDKLRLKVWSRPAGSSYTGAPSSADGDTLVSTTDFPTSGFTATAAAQTITLRPAWIPIVAGTIYLFQVIPLMTDGSPGKIGFSYGAALAADPNYVHGYYQPPAGNWVNYGAGLLRGVAFVATRAGIAAATPPVAVLDTRLAAVEGAIDYNYVALASIGGDNDAWSGAAGFSAWGFGCLPSGSETISRVSIDADYVASNTRLRVMVYQRPVANAASTSGPGAAGDVLVSTTYYAPSDFEAGNDSQTIDLVIPDVAATPANIVIFGVAGLGAADAPGALGAMHDIADGVHDQYVHGWFKKTGAWQVVTTTFIVSRIVAKRGAAKFKGSAGAVAYSQYDAAKPTAEVSGLVVDLTGSTIEQDGEQVSLSGSVTLSATTSASGSMSNVALVYSTFDAPTGGIALSDGVDGVGNPARVRNASNVVVTRRSDSVVLTEGTDYMVYGPAASVRGINASVSTVQVDVTFDYLPERYDVIQVHAETHALSVAAGTARKWDAQEDAYRGATTPNNLPLYYAYVAGSTVKLVDASGWADGVIQRGREADWQRCRLSARHALRNALKRLTAGSAVTLAGYGDSITAMQSGVPAFTAGGVKRDRKEYFENYPSETIAGVGLYDFGDGQGMVHVKAGWNWQLKAFLEARYSSAITYSNYGIASTTSESTANNGLDPTRIAQIVSDAPHLVVLAFGMNEIGSATTYANICNIIGQLRAVGADVIVMGCPRISATGGRAPVSSWRMTNRALRRAALDSGAAWVPMLYAMDDDALGYMGIHPDTLTGVNGYNHPGPREHRLYGALVASLFE